MSIFAVRENVRKSFLMSVYPPKILEKFINPQNVGVCEGENASVRNASIVCGASLKLSLQINKTSQTIEKAKFHALGCGFLTASAETLCEKINRKTPKIEETEDLFAQIKTEIGNLPESRNHCLHLCFETLENALNKFRSIKSNSWNGEEALICTCFGVSETEIQRVIAENLCETVEDVTRNCNAGGGCGSCQPLIEEILEFSWLENGL